MSEAELVTHPTLPPYVPKTFGRPAKYKEPEELRQTIQEYFQACFNNTPKPKPPTIAGLALFLGFADRQSLYDYEKKKLGFEHFSCILKAARTYIEDLIETGMLSGAIQTIPAIFTLKNHHGWADKQEVAVNQVTSFGWNDATRALPEALDGKPEPNGATHDE